MNFSWNGTFGWYCVACEQDGQTVARTQTTLCKQILVDHDELDADFIRRTPGATACHSRKFMLTFDVDLTTRQIDGRAPKQLPTNKLHRRSPRGERPLCHVRRGNLTDDDEAVTCSNCVHGIRREREYRERFADETGGVNGCDASGPELE